MQARAGYGYIIYFTVAIALAIYFGFAALRGDLGVHERLVATAELVELRETRDRLQGSVDEMANLTRRLSDSYLDLDLLDERARSVLGLMRADELIVR